MDKQVKVAIIGGYGKMGRWLANYLLQDGQEVILIGRNEEKLLEARKQLGVEATTSIEAVKNADVIVLSVPIDSFEEAVSKLPPYLHGEQIILDITSIKSSPVEIMHRYIKRGVVLGTHPVFGPGAKGIQNQNIVLTPTNERETPLANKIKQYLEARGARATLMTPEEHDEMMAVILGLAHFISIVSADTLLRFEKLKEMEEIGGTTYRLLLTLVQSVISEDPELYASLQMHLPRIKEVEAIFQKQVTKWADIVKKGDRQEFATQMYNLKDRVKEIDPDFDRAYENMYRILEK